MAIKEKILLQMQADLRGIKQVQLETAKLQGQFVGLKKAFAVGGALGLGALSFQGLARGMKNAVAAGFKFNAMIESQSIAFKTLLGDQHAANKRIQELTEFAATTPFQLDEVIKANRILQVLGGELLASSEGMRLVGDSAAAAARNFEEVAIWVGRLYAGLKTGTPVGEATLRLLEMGVVSGDLKLKLDDLAKLGALGASNAMQVLRESFSATRGAMQDLSETQTGMMSTFKDTITFMLGDVTKEAFEFWKRNLRSILEMLGAMPTAIQEATAAMTGGSLATIDESRAVISEEDRLRRVARLGELLKANDAHRRQQVARELEIEQVRLRGYGSTTAGSNRAVSPANIAETEADIAARMVLINQERLAIESALEFLGSQRAVDAIKANKAEAEAARLAVIAAKQLALIEEESAEDIKIFDKLALDSIKEQYKAQLKLNELKRSLNNEQRMFTAEFFGRGGEEGEMIAQERREMEIEALLISEEQKNDAIFTSQQLHEQKMLKLRSDRLRAEHEKELSNAAAMQAIRDQQFQGAQTMFGNMAHVARTFGSESFIAFKVFASAEAVVAAILATQKALASVPPPYNYVAAAAAAAAGAANVVKINATQPAGFQDGGFTGTGPRSEVAGVVHRGEFVVPAPVVDRVGVASLQGLTSTASEAPNVNVAPSAVHVAVLDNEQALGRFLESRQGQQIIVDTVRRRKFDIG